MEQCGSDPAKEVKEDESEMPETVLDIVAEDPEVEHIAEDMEKSAMHEHGSEERERWMDRLCRLHRNDIVRYGAIRIDDLLPASAAEHLKDEDSDIQRNDADCDGREGARWVIVLIREHFLFPLHFATPRPDRF